MIVFARHIWRRYGIKGSDETLFVPISVEHVACPGWREPALLHAVAVDHLRSVAHRRRTLDAACGARAVLSSQRIQIVEPDGTPTGRHQLYVPVWPIKGFPNPQDKTVRRCRACWLATGSKSPDWMYRDSALTEPFAGLELLVGRRA